MARVLAFLVSLGWLAMPQAADPAEQPPEEATVLRRIFDDWAARRARFPRAVYEVEGTALVPSGRVRKDASGRAVGRRRESEFRVSCRAELDFERGLARYERHWPLLNPGGKPVMNWQATLFDGEQRTQLAPRDRNPWVPENVIYTDIWYRWPRNMVFFSGCDPLLYGHGLVRAPVAPERLQTPDGPEGVNVARREEYEGRSCVVLQTNQFVKYKDVAPTENPGPWMDEIWVDVERESAVLRRDRFAGGKLMLRIAVTYEETEAGWWPAAWVYDEHPGLAAATHTEVAVLSRETGSPLPPERFKIDPEPGIVFNRDGKSLVIPAEGQEPIEAAEYWRRTHKRN